MTALFNYIYYFTLTVARVENGAIETKTYTFVSKSQKGSTLPQGYWPLLQSVGEVALTAGETLPEVTLSSVEIDNTIGSFGPNRKFSDVLQRYTPVEQPITILVDRISTVDDVTQNSGALKIIGTGVVSDWSANSADGQGTITFNIRPTKIANTVLNVEVARTVTGPFNMANAPQSSLGRAVPLAIGEDCEIIPIRITADGSETPVYAVTTMLTQFLKSDLSAAKLHTKNDLDEWEEILNNYTDTSSQTSAGTFTLNTYAYRAFCLIKPSGNASALVTGIRLQCKGNGITTSTARLSVVLLRYDPFSLQVIEEVTKATVPLTIYDNKRAFAAFPISIPFDDVVFLSSKESYAIGYTVANYQIGDLSIHYTTTSGFTNWEFQKDSGDSNSANGLEWKLGGFSSGLMYQLIAYQPQYDASNVVGDSSGLNYSILNILPNGGVDSGLAFTPPDNIPLLISGIKGLIPHAGGATVERPQSIAELLNYRWNGSSWVTNNNFDSTSLLSSHYEFLYNGATPSIRSRVARGTFESKTTYSQLLADLCRGTASRVGILPDGKLFMYPFGQTVTPVRDIPYADITSIEWTQGDISTVINKAVIKIGRTYLKAPRTFENASTTGNQYTIDFNANNYPAVASITQESRLLYGTKELADDDFNIWPYNATNGGYLTGSSTDQGSILGEYYLTRFGKPLTYCTFIVPFDRYNELKMFDVITFTSVNFPAFYGTDANARDGTVNVGGAVTPVVTADGGNEMVRAQTYRGLIEGVVYIMAMEHAPAIRLVVQVLLNQPHDPT